VEIGRPLLMTLPSVATNGKATVLRVSGSYRACRTLATS